MHHNRHYKIVKLVSNLANVAKIQDTTLLNSWGMVIDKCSLWVAENHSGMLVNYNLNDLNESQQYPISVTLTLPNQLPASPTGLIQNFTRGFKINNVPCSLLTCTEDGFVFAHVPTINTNNGIIVINNAVNNAVYKGLAIAGEKLYLADFHNAKIDVFDSNFIQQSGFQFIDSNIPSGYAPFNIVKIGTKLIVAYAKQDTSAVDSVPSLGFGFVSIFNFDGTFYKRFATQGQLNSPWGIARGPKKLHLEHTILIGNFGDGIINIYSDCGDYIGPLNNIFDRPITINGLWDIKYDDKKLFFTAGPNNETNGLVGYIKNKSDKDLQTRLVYVK